jgi:uncharacterized cupin superfamily protein
MTTAKAPIHDTDVENRAWYPGTDREIHGRALSDVGGMAKVGFGILELSPGCNTLPAHYHTLEEDHLYVLEGNGTLHLGDRTYPLTTGSYVNFPAGQGAPHFVSNESKEPLRYIMVGERIHNDKVIYPNND